MLKTYVVALLFYLNWLCNFLAPEKKQLMLDFRIKQIVDLNNNVNFVNFNLYFPSCFLLQTKVTPSASATDPGYPGDQESSGLTAEPFLNQPGGPPTPDPLMQWDPGWLPSSLIPIHPLTPPSFLLPHLTP